MARKEDRGTEHHQRCVSGGSGIRMLRRAVLRDDGRYLIYYSFPREDHPGSPEGDPKVSPRKNV